MSQARNRLAVLGSPIAHSRSPRLHRAAYAYLGLPWHYDAIELTSDALPAFLASRGDDWRGLSLTMPLKRTVLPLLASLDQAAQSAGGANTVYFDDSKPKLTLRGFNTDVYGIVEALHAGGVDQLSTVQILGSGATAASALLAASAMGATRVVVSARTPSHADVLARMGAALDLLLEVRPLDITDTQLIPDVVISTIPGGVGNAVSFSDALMRRATLLEVAYDPWPTPLAASWAASEGTVISGLEMLLYQALAQVRIFVGGHPDAVLASEAAVVAAMRSSISTD